MTLPHQELLILLSRVLLSCATVHVVRHYLYLWVLGQNGSGQNGTDKWYG